nr:hypothetical protein [uncultured Roseateles sp.]
MRDISENYFKSTKAKGNPDKKPPSPPALSLCVKINRHKAERLPCQPTQALQPISGNTTSPSKDKQ